MIEIDDLQERLAVLAGYIKHEVPDEDSDGNHFMDVHWETPDEDEVDSLPLIDELMELVEAKFTVIKVKSEIDNLLIDERIEAIKKRLNARDELRDLPSSERGTIRHRMLDDMTYDGEVDRDFRLLLPYIARLKTALILVGACNYDEMERAHEIVEHALGSGKLHPDAE